jgi:hypothetical protein
VVVGGGGGGGGGADGICSLIIETTRSDLPGCAISKHASSAGGSAQVWVRSGSVHAKV